MDYEKQLVDIVTNNNDLMMILRTVRDLNLKNWAVGAGMLRDIVWSKLHNYSISSFKDIDVVYFDDQVDGSIDAYVEEQLYELMPEYPWDVKNQAYVHKWYAAKFGFEVRPLVSINDAISTWPETATCIGISLTKDDGIVIYAPHGLEDLFEMKLRWNQTRVPIEEFWRRLEDKNLVDKWPLMTVISDY